MKKRPREKGDSYNLVWCFHSDERISGSLHVVSQVELLCNCRTCVSVDTHTHRELKHCDMFTHCLYVLSILITHPLTALPPQVQTVFPSLIEKVDVCVVFH